MKNTYVVSIASEAAPNLLVEARIAISAGGVRVVEELVTSIDLGVDDDAAALYSLNEGQLIDAGIALLVRLGLLEHAGVERLPKSRPAAQAHDMVGERGRLLDTPRKQRPTSRSEREIGSARGPTGATDLPPPPDLAMVYWRQGSIRKVAKHYDVRHSVAQSWIAGLRQQGRLPNPWRARPK